MGKFPSPLFFVKGDKGDKIMADKFYLVKNRSASRVHYSVPELGIKSRDFMPGETKRISKAELEGLSYLPGGLKLIRNYLLITDEEARAEFIGHVEPEYNMTESDVKNLILYGSLDEWLDCLDFAPAGVIDLIKTLSIELPLTDTVKMAEFKKKKGVDLARMIRAKQEEEAEIAAAQAQQSQAPQRRVQPQQAPVAPQAPARRTSGSKYKVVKKEAPTE
jgi:hypothetical protein